MGSEFQLFLNAREAGNPGKDFWSFECRLAVFALASTSILSLLVEFSGAQSMRAFSLLVSLPALLALLAWALVDRASGSQRLWRGVVVGSLAGWAATIACDISVVPFVVARDPDIERLRFFKIIQSFGALILGQPVEQPLYSPMARLAGWAYHFSNGVTFGIMYVVLVGDAGRRHWGWAMLFAAALELGMLFTPYVKFFGIPFTPKFVAITLVAHLVFGLVMGLTAQVLSRLLTPSVLR